MSMCMSGRRLTELRLDIFTYMSMCMSGRRLTDLSCAWIYLHTCQCVCRGGVWLNWNAPRYIYIHVNVCVEAAFDWFQLRLAAFSNISMCLLRRQLYSVWDMYIIHIYIHTHIYIYVFCSRSSWLASRRRLTAASCA